MANLIWQFSTNEPICTYAGDLSTCERGSRFVILSGTLFKASFDDILRLVGQINKFHSIDNSFFRVTVHCPIYIIFIIVIKWFYYYSSCIFIYGLFDIFLFIFLHLLLWWSWRTNSLYCWCYFCFIFYFENVKKMRKFKPKTFSQVLKYLLKTDISMKCLLIIVIYDLSSFR